MTDKISWLIRLTRMLHVALLFACFGVSVPAIAQIFVDEFDTNSIGTTWESIGTSLQTTPGTFTPARIENGYAALEMNMTDAGAIIRMHAAKLPGGVFPRKFRLEIRHMMHPGNEYFYPSFQFTDAAGAKYLGVMFPKSVYVGGVCESNGLDNVLVYGGHFSSPTVAGECFDHLSYYTKYRSSNYYDQWITTSLSYDQDTGAVSLDIGNDGSIEFSDVMPAADRPVIETFGVAGFGWWTGHWQRVDYIKIFDLTQATTSPTVTSITPKTATLNVLQQFTITGTNLTSGMGFTIQDCDPSNQEVGTGTTTQRTFQCTPRGTTGTKYATIKTAPGGTVIPVAGAQTTPITITNATGLRAPVLSILPAATAAAGTSMTISFTAVANATSYKLCTGSAAGTYTGCAAIKSPYTFPMAAGFDKYMAVKAINTQGESAYSNELHLKSTTSAPTSLQAPVISIAPSATAASGTTLTLSFAPVPNATSYQLCYGSSSGNYAKCMPVTSPYSIKMTDGLDYYVAVKAVNTSLVSGYSNELHVVSVSPFSRQLLYVDAISKPNATNHISKGVKNSVVWDNKLITGSTVDIFYLNGSSIGIGTPPELSQLKSKPIIEIARGVQNTGMHLFQYAGRKLNPRIIVIGSDAGWSISQPTASQLPTPAGEQQITETDIKVYMTSDKTKYSENDPIRISFISIPSDSSSQNKYNLRLIVYPESQPDTIYHFDGAHFVQSETFWAKNVQMPNIPDWFDTPIALRWNSKATNEKYTFILTVEDSDANPVASANFTVDYSSATSKAVASSVSVDKSLSSVISPSEKSIMFKTTVANDDSYKFAVEKMQTLGKAVAWGYNIYQTAEPFLKYEKYIDDVKHMQEDFYNWKDDGLLGRHADNLLAINMMVKLASYSDKFTSFDEKKLMTAVKKVFASMSSRQDALDAVTGSINIGFNIIDDCWGRCDSSLRVSVSMLPIMVCSEFGTGVNFGNCPKGSLLTADNIESSYLVGCAGSSSCANTVFEVDGFARMGHVTGAYPGWYLVEVRRQDNDAVVHRETIFATYSQDFPLVIKKAAIKATR